MPFKVLIAGAGPAGLEAALALHDLAGERVETTLLAPDDELTYRPLSVAEPFSLATTRRYPLDTIARDLGVERVVDRLAAVVPEAHVARTAGGERLEWDALLVALGARAVPAFERAITFWGPGDSEAVHGLVQDVEHGYARRVAFVVPPGSAWSLPLYELALLTAARAFEANRTLALHVITPEDAPLGVFGTHASQSLVALLHNAGIVLHAGAYAEAVGHGTLELRPGGDGSRSAGSWPSRASPATRCRVCRATPPGSCRSTSTRACAAPATCGRRATSTDFPLKQGGIATQQADVAAGPSPRARARPSRPSPSGRSCAACC